MPYLIGLGGRLRSDHPAFRYCDFPMRGPGVEALPGVWRSREEPVLIGGLLLVLKTPAGAEPLFTVRAAEAVTKKSLMPLLTMKGTDTVRLAIFQSIAEPYAELAGLWG